MINRVAKKRTICEILREINDLHQRESRHDKAIRLKLSEAEYMAKRMSKKLIELQPDIFDKGWWKKNPDFNKDIDLRMNDLYKIITSEEEKDRMMRREQYIEIAKEIPSLGSGGIGIYKELIGYASKVLKDQAIIELGPWLGSATAFLSIGSMYGNNAIIHSYDMWESSQVYTRRAIKHGLNFTVGQDLEPVFRDNLAKFKFIEPHKQSIFDIDWKGPKVGLIIIDMGNGKKHTDQAIEAFKDYFIPGETIIFMMDYFFAEPGRSEMYYYQKNLYEANKKRLEFIVNPAKSKTAIFRYLGGEIKYVDGYSYPKDLNEGVDAKKHG